MLSLEQQKFLIDAQLQLNKLADESGVTVKVDVRGNGTLSCEFSQSEREAQIEFSMYASKFGYKADWFGKTFHQGGTTYRIVGVKPTAEKNCLRIARIKDGKEFVCAPGFVPLDQQQELA